MRKRLHLLLILLGHVGLQEQVGAKQVRELRSEAAVAAVLLLTAALRVPSRWPIRVQPRRLRLKGLQRVWSSSKMQKI